MKKERLLKAFKIAVPYSLPIMAGYEILGFGFGLLLHSKGYSVFWAFIMSLFIYAGSMQYVTIDLLTSGASLLSAGLMTFMVNARHLFYGISMLIKYRNMGKVKPYLIFGLTDECYSVVSHVEPPEGVDRRYFFFIFTMINQLYWISGSVLGALFGTIIPVNTKGVDFSMTALFVVVVLDNIMKKNDRVFSLLGIACSIVCLLIFGPNNFLIPSMISIMIALLLARSKFEEKEIVND